MALSNTQKEKIKELLTKTIEGKLKKYSRESKSMPFLSMLMQDDEKVAAYSFIHSIATTLGMSLYEQLSVIIASENSEEAARNVKVGGKISIAQKNKISEICNTLREGGKSSIEREIEEVLSSSSEGAKEQKDGNIADFYMKREGIEYYFEIKTVKPNIDVFNKSKVKLLEWVARKGKKIKPYLAFPYNPYAPEPYTRFTIQNMMDYPHDFLVGEEYWDLLGGENTYNELIEITDTVGKELKTKVQEKIKNIAQTKIGDKENI